MNNNCRSLEQNWGGRNPLSVGKMAKSVAIAATRTRQVEPCQPSCSKRQGFIAKFAVLTPCVPHPFGCCRESPPLGIAWVHGKLEQGRANQSPWFSHLARSGKGIHQRPAMLETNWFVAKLGNLKNGVGFPSKPTKTSFPKTKKYLNSCSTKRSGSWL